MAYGNKKGKAGHDLVVPATYPGHDPGTYPAPNAMPSAQSFSSPAVFCPHTSEPISVNQKRPGGERGGDAGAKMGKY